MTIDGTERMLTPDEEQDRPTMAEPIITGNWELDQDLLALARMAVQILAEGRPRYADYRTRRETDHG